VGFQTAFLLHSNLKGVDVRIIEIDRDKCRRVAGELPKATILWGDGADEELLTLEGIENTGGFVAATENDEVNLVLASQAKMLGARQSIAVIRRKSYMKLLEAMPIDAIVSRNDALSSVLIGAVRNSESASTLALLDQIGAETLRVSIPDGSPAIGVELKDLPLPPGSLLGLVRRDAGELFIPTGKSSLAAGDDVIVFSALDAVDDVLKTLGVSVD
jgi:trk system potassium uptake protein TrkA